MNSRFRLSTVASLFLLLSLAACAPDPETNTDPASEVTIPADAPPAEPGWFERTTPAFDTLVPADARVEVLAEGFEWSEGPVWVPDGGFLLFSDVPTNRIYRWQPGETGATVWLTPSGYTGDEPRGGEPGSNGLVLDGEGRLLLAQHGDRRIARLEAPWDAPEPQFGTVAAGPDGEALNSPNDLVIHPSGAVLFTDPPYGLDPNRETREREEHGVYRSLPDGSIALISAELDRPNGIALSPDASTLYVANSDPERALWMRWSLGQDTLDGSDPLPEGEVFFDATQHVGDEEPGLPDGMAVDTAGNLFATGPGGVWVFSPEGEVLGRIRIRQPTANCTFGEDGSSLFVTADHQLLRIRLTTHGLGMDPAG